METQELIDNKVVMIKMVMDAWALYNKRVDDLLAKLTDEQLQSEVSPSRNTGIYLLGHLVSVNDRISPIMGFENPLYPELENIFLTSPDKSGHQMPTIAELKKYWAEINARLMHNFSKMQPEEWFKKHTSVSEEDFAKEPHRNKLNILINRTNHQSYHLGQMALL